MRAYTVHAPPEEPMPPERLAFVKDGFCWPALFVPLLWILWHRLWLTLVWYVVFVLAVAWVGRLFGDTNATIMALLGSVLFALEANDIRRLSLASRGWRDVGGSFGKGIDEAEIRFFETWGTRAEQAERREALARATYSPAALGHRGDEPIFGLFPEPER